MAPRVLLVLPTATYRAEAFLTAAARAGVEVAVASDAAGTLTMRATGREVVVDLGRPDAAAEAVAAAGLTPDAVVGVDESSVLVAAHIAAALGLRHHPVAAVAATRDKRRLRTRLDDAGLHQPRWRETSTGADPEAVAIAVAAVGGPPVVVKPVDLAASRGVLRCDDTAATVTALGRLGRLLDRLGCTAGPAGHPALIERYVDGLEVAVEGLVVDGRVHVLAVFDKPEPLEGPTFAETIYTTPSRHRPATLAQLTALTVTAAAAIGLREGPLHAELRLSPSGPVLIEVAARSIGGLCSSALRLGPAGRSLEEVILAAALGTVDPADLETVRAASGVLMLPVPAAGRLVEVGGVAAARAVEGVDSVRISVPPGTAVEPLPEGDRYLGFVVARGPGPVEVEIALRRARSRLEVRIEP